MNTAVILAAGEGRKIWPYSGTRQKAALPLANKPLIRWQVEKLRHVGIENIIIVVGYRKQQVLAALSGVDNLRFIDQQGTGTVSALLSAVDHIKDDFLLLYGDAVITLADYQNFLGKSGDAICTALLTPLDKEPPQNWMCAAVSDDIVTMYHKGLNKILEKVGEECTETLIAAKDAEHSGNTSDVVYETADLWFHSLVMLKQLGLDHTAVLEELARRFGLSGLEEKAQRSKNP